MFTVFSFKLASIEVWKQSISSQGCIFGLEFKPDGTSWKKPPCEICHCEVGIYGLLTRSEVKMLEEFLFSRADAVEVNKNGKRK